MLKFRFNNNKKNTIKKKAHYSAFPNLQFVHEVNKYLFQF